MERGGNERLGRGLSLCIHCGTRLIIGFFLLIKPFLKKRGKVIYISFQSDGVYMMALFIAVALPTGFCYCYSSVSD